MSMALQISAKSGALHVKATGKFSLAEAKRTFGEMMRAMVQHKADKVLFDGRTVDGNPKVMERFYFGEFAAHTVNDHALLELCRYPRFAYVLQEPMLDPARFGETVAVNRGMHIRAFDNINDAQTWLGATSASETA